MTPHCELLDMSRVAAQTKGLDPKKVACPYLATQACEGVNMGPNPVMPPCWMIDTVPPLADHLPKGERSRKNPRVALFNSRMEVTITGRRPVSTHAS